MTRSSRAFLPLFALANAGGAIAYVPLLTLLVPMQVEAIAPAERIAVLSAVTIVGAVMASLANIGWGIVSDRSFRRHGSRRGPIAAGLVLTIATYAGVAAASEPWMLVVAVAAFQIAVNLMLSPLGAVMADVVPDEQKGLAGGIVVLAGPAGAIVAAGVAALWIGEGARLAIVALVVALGVAPLLIHGVPAAPPIPQAEQGTRARDLLRLSVGRLLVQIASSTLFTYLLFYFETLPGERAGADLPERIARLTMAAFLIAAPLGLIAGRWSDRMARRKPFLLASAGVAAAALAVMAWRADVVIAAAGYMTFVLASNVFLGLQTAFVMQVLPSPATRARDLGIVNLANTLPSLLSATLAWSLVGRYGFAPLLALLCVLVSAGGILTLTVRSRR